MEVVIAIMLLFGAFSLGSAMNDGADADPVVNVSPATSNEVQDESVSAPGRDDVGDLRPHNCSTSHHHVIYRDLTHAVVPEVDGETTHVCVYDGTCADE